MRHWTGKSKFLRFVALRVRVLGVLGVTILFLAGCRTLPPLEPVPVGHSSFRRGFVCLPIRPPAQRNPFGSTTKGRISFLRGIVPSGSYYLFLPDRKGFREHPFEAPMGDTGGRRFFLISPTTRAIAGERMDTKNTQNPYR